MPTLPSGFVTRVKGKVSFGAVMPFQEQIVETLASTAQGASYSIYPGGVTIIRSTVGSAYFTMPVPEAGTIKTLVLSTLSSAVTIRTNSTGAGGVYFDSTSFTMIHPSSDITKIQTYRFMAVSSILWVTLTANQYSTITLSTAIGTSS